MLLLDNAQVKIESDYKSNIAKCNAGKIPPLSFSSIVAILP